MRSTGLRAALQLFVSHPLIIGLAPARHFSSSESGADSPPLVDPGLGPFFEATSDPMVVFGPDFIVLMANAAACRLLRVPDGQLIGRSVLESALLARVIGGASVPQRPWRSARCCRGRSKSAGAIARSSCLLSATRCSPRSMAPRLARRLSPRSGASPVFTSARTSSRSRYWSARNEPWLLGSAT